jgi:hypothetical protein
MPQSSKQLVQRFNARLSEIEKQLSSLKAERELLLSVGKATAGTVSRPGRVKTKATISAASRKRMAAARKAKWAKAKRLGLKNLAELAAHEKKEGK